MADRRSWTIQEDQIILELIHKHGTSLWTTIAADMKILTSSYRTSKQIRERWYNQLSPCISRSPWTNFQESTLFDTHAKIGNRWKDIARVLPGRTDNAVKNHFYSTVRRALRRLDKYFGFKDSTAKMRNMKPAALTHLMEIARTHKDYSQMMDMLLQFAQQKPILAKSSKQDYKIELYENIIEIINNHKQSMSRISQHYRGKSQQDQTHCEGNQHTLDKQDLQGHSVDIPQAQLECNDSSQNNNENSVFDEQPQENEASNYFGSGVQTKSWFNVHERESGLDGCEPIFCNNFFQ